MDLPWVDSSHAIVHCLNHMIVCQREMPVFGLIHGEVVVGIMVCPSCLNHIRLLLTLALGRSCQDASPASQPRPNFKEPKETFE
jgi:hypothetical protein